MKGRSSEEKNVVKEKDVIGEKNAVKKIDATGGKNAVKKRNARKKSRSLQVRCEFIIDVSSNLEVIFVSRPSRSAVLQLQCSFTIYSNSGD